MNGGICLADGTCQYPQYNWLDLSSSNIRLTSTEKSYLYAMISSYTTGTLLYRATRDGFGVSSFHTRCDKVPNRFTIIRNSFNYVFGGFTAARWSSTAGYIEDPTAFIFSLKRNGI